MYGSVSSLERAQCFTAKMSGATRGSACVYALNNSVLRTVTGLQIDKSHLIFLSSRMNIPNLHQYDTLTLLDHKILQ